MRLAGYATLLCLLTPGYAAGPIQTGYEEKLTMYRCVSYCNRIRAMSETEPSLYKQGAFCDRVRVHAS